MAELDAIRARKLWKKQKKDTINKKEKILKIG